MRINSLYKADSQNGIGWGVTIGLQGCPLRCKGCFNKSAWDFSGGQYFDDRLFSKTMDMLKEEYIDHLAIIGGEPLTPSNVRSLSYLIAAVRQEYPDKKIWLWSGYEFEQIYRMAFDQTLYEGIYPTTVSWTWLEKKALRDILLNLDVLVDGPFIQEKRDITLKWRGSSNQRVIDMRATMRQDVSIDPDNPPTPILFCD